MDFNFPGLFIQSQIGGVNLIAGGLLKLYDGAQVTEQSFLQWPDTPVVVSVGSAGAMTEGSYFYKAVYEWTDAKGNFYQSVVSETQTEGMEATIPTGVTNGSVKISVSTLRVSLRQNVVIAIYRSLSYDALNFRRIGQLTNDPNVDYLEYDDLQSDEQIKNNTLLYTDTGEYDNDPAPNCTSIVVGKTRVFLINDDNGNLQYSKPFLPNFGMGMSDFLYVAIDGFIPTGVGIIDDKVIEFDATKTYWFTGDGPDAAGQNGIFYPPQTLTTDVGCTNPASITRGPDGLYFKSQRGIQRINRSLESDYIGAPVEAWNNYDITSSVMIPSLNQIRFLTSSGPCLVYDYFVGQWQTFDNHSGFDAVLWEGKYTYLKNNGQVFVQNPDSYTDAGVEYNLTLSTSWLNLGQIQGYKRIRRASFLGQFKGNCTILVKMYYDYDENFFDSFTFDTQSAMNVVNFGDGGVFGEGIYGTTGDDVLQWRVAVPRQKIQAIRFEFSDVSNSGNSYALAAIDIEVGVIGGLGRLGAAKSLGG
jgi:hypothetical protein